MRIHFPLVTAFALLLLLNSCGPPKAITRIDIYEKRNYERIALLQVMMSEFKQPVIPIMDAAIFNGKTNDLATEIMDLQEGYIDTIRTLVAAKMQEKFSDQIIYGAELQDLEAWKSLRETHNFNENLLTGNSNFPIVLLADGELNVFRFDNGNAVRYFTRDSRYPRLISNLCQELGVDAIAVSITHFEVMRVGAFGINGSLRLSTHFFVIDGERGAMVTRGMVGSPPMSISGSELVDYKLKLNQFPEILDLLFASLN